MCIALTSFCTWENNKENFLSSRVQTWTPLCRRNHSLGHKDYSATKCHRPATFYLFLLWIFSKTHICLILYPKCKQGINGFIFLIQYFFFTLSRTLLGCDDGFFYKGTQVWTLSESTFSFFFFFWEHKPVEIIHTV